MNKDVLISIQPQHVKNICTVVGEENGNPIYKKTIEVRKTHPQLETPFPCYIYETKGKRETFNVVATDPSFCGIRRTPPLFIKGFYEGRGKVIGEFVCDRIYEIKNLGSRFMVDNDVALTNRIARASCLQFADLQAYLGKKNGYAWHISDLKIYDTPKELGEFRKSLETVRCIYFNQLGCEPGCISYGSTDYYCKEYWDWERGLTRPPQSWCYVEEI